MISFAEKRQAFLDSLRFKIPPEPSTSHEPTKNDVMALLEKQYYELFGPLDYGV